MHNCYAKLPHYHEGLLLEPNVTSTKAVKMACQTISIAESQSYDSASVQAMITKHSVDFSSTKTHCTCCRCANHLEYAPSFPALKVKCKACGKVGQFSKVCHAAQKAVREVVVLEVTVLYLNDAEPEKDKIIWKVQIEAPAEQTCNVELIRALQSLFCQNSWTTDILPTAL